jgi:hypothetical protein
LNTSQGDLDSSNGTNSGFFRFGLECCNFFPNGSSIVSEHSPQTPKKWPNSQNQLPQTEHLDSFFLIGDISNWNVRAAALQDTNDICNKEFLLRIILQPR